MAKQPDEKDFIAEWFQKIGAQHRVKAVCKPCWEIKYCPYGPLVEEFPLGEENDERRCRIFGHQCPVFHVAEPFTETKVLRNISRTIPRPVQFRVLKRDNQICRQCGQPVRDNDIHFDHIIPWSKGGSSDEPNIQLLCGSCNRKKGDQFEADHLVSGVSDHLVDPVGADILPFLLMIVFFSHDFKATEGRLPDSDDVARLLNRGIRTHAEEQAGTIIADLHEFFRNGPPKEISRNTFRALRVRWGFLDGKRHSLKSSATRFRVNPEDFLAAEISLVGRLGWRVSLSKKEKSKWLRS